MDSYLAHLMQNNPQKMHFWTNCIFCHFGPILSPQSSKITTNWPFLTQTKSVHVQGTSCYVIWHSNLTLGQIWRNKNPIFGAFLAFLPIFDPYLGPNELKWHIFHLMCGHTYWPDSMSSYLAHLMQKKAPKMHFWAHLVFKMAFFALFCPPCAKNTWYDLL